VIAHAVVGLDPTTLAPATVLSGQRFEQAGISEVLYESIIPAEQRHRLGEYYTPDWLAERMVDEVVDQPLEQRVLDPACGSGTFLFHAVRHFIEAADAADHAPADAITGATRHVIGIDVHPVAITLARLTYLLGIGRDRL
jgi:type I restriction-modification system DNA methylase subunit